MSAPALIDHGPRINDATSTGSCVRGCTRRGEHYATCPSTVAGVPGCTGCAPRAAVPGDALCSACHHHLEAALGDAADVLGALRSIADPGRSVAFNPAKVSSSGAQPREPISADVLDAYQEIAANLHDWAATLNPRTPALPGAGASADDIYAAASAWASTITRRRSALTVTSDQALALAEALIQRHTRDTAGAMRWSVVDATARWLGRSSTPDEQPSPPASADTDETTIAALPIHEWGDPLISAADAAARAQVSARTLRRWVRQGILTPARRVRVGTASADMFQGSDVDRAAAAMSGRRHRGVTLDAAPQADELAASVGTERVTDDAYAALTAALADRRPGCVDVPAFTDDDLDAAQLATLTAVCAACPALEQCRAYAIASQPEAGYWAGAPAFTYRRTASDPALTPQIQSDGAIRADTA